MITNEEIFQIIRPIILSVTGIPQCILADPNAPAPSGDYAAVRTKGNLAQQGQANIITVNGVAPNTVDISVRAQIVTECVVDFYVRFDQADFQTGLNAMGFASLLQMANKQPAVSQALFQASPQALGWQRTTPIQNLTALQSNNWEQRAQISIYLMYEFIPTTPINTESIEQVLINIEDENAVILESVNIATEDAP